jgi:hypothetical protein
MEAIRQHVGRPCGYIKPVGQSWVLDDEGNRIDKDAPVFQSHFGLGE